MNIAKTDLVFIGLAVASGAASYFLNGTSAVKDAFQHAAKLLIVVLPQLLGGLLIGGLFQQLVSREKITALLGAKSGIRGLGLATLAGALTPGGPFTSFPLVYALWMAGAEAGALITYITAWSLLGFNRIIVWEIPLMGAEFSWIRILVCLPLPILAGLLAQRLSGMPVFRLKQRAED